MLHRSRAVRQLFTYWNGCQNPSHAVNRTKALLYRSATTIAAPAEQPPVITPAAASDSSLTIPLELTTSNLPAKPPRKHSSPSPFAYHWETSPPNALQLQVASRFFTRHPPDLLYSATSFRSVKISTLPELAVLGRSNVGKSSLLNAVLGQKLCHTSKQPGRTRTMNFIAVGGEDGNGNKGRMVVLDLPGYGAGSRADWGKEIMKYLVGRRQLKRAFVLMDPHHGLKGSDKELLNLLRQHGISHQVILSKADRILWHGSKVLNKKRLKNNTGHLTKICEKLREEIQPKNCEFPVALGELISCSAEKKIEGQGIGIDALRWAMLRAAGLDRPRKKLSALQMPVQEGIEASGADHEDDLWQPG